MRKLAFYASLHRTEETCVINHEFLYTARCVDILETALNVIDCFIDFIGAHFMF